MNVRFMAMGALWLLASVANAQSSEPAQGPVGAALQNREPVGPIPGPPRARKAMANPYRNDADALRDGRHLFVSFNCSGCHGDHAGGGMGPSLRDEDWIYGSEAADIFDSISEGRAHGMPAWGSMLPPQYVWQLVTYIQSLRTPQEPDKPE
jgi:cytochrome c oxidase cbb3-type subunit 3